MMHSNWTVQYQQHNESLFMMVPVHSGRHNVLPEGGKNKYQTHTVDIFSMAMGSDSFAPCLLAPSNHLLSWHFSELGDDTARQLSLMSSSYSKRWVIQLKRSETRSATPVHTQWRIASKSQSMGCQFLCEVYKSNMELQSYFDIGNRTRNSNFSDVRNLWCIFFSLRFSSSFFFFAPSM